MSERSSLALLLIAYRRVETLGSILETASSSGVENVYIVIDKSPRKELFSIQEEIALLCEKYRSSFNSMRIVKRNRNVGCAASVMTGIDWIFKYEKFACILEDDCIPTSDFFAFVQASRRFLELDRDILLACGTQFAPKNISHAAWIKSRYALTWGWATTKENWSLIRSGILNSKGLLSPNTRNFTIKRVLDTEDQYWNSGARRARSGYVDVWDTILLQIMRLNKKYSLLPSESLVKNVGNDVNATHTTSSKWTHKATGTFPKQYSQPEISTATDLWLKRYFFKISIRHHISTRITQIIDLFRSPIRPTLQDQFNTNQITDL